jgi:hypothetical protein
MAEVESPKDFWKTRELDDGVTYLWQAGPLEIRLCREGEDWFLHSEFEAGRSAEVLFTTCQAQVDSDWTRIAYGQAYTSVSPRPTLPDRPLVLKTDNETLIPMGLRATFYLSLPLWVTLTAHPKLGAMAQAREHTAIASSQLSNSWHGDSFSGTLCYALRTPAHHDPEHLGHAVLRATSMLTLFNNSDAPLSIKSLCIDVGHLSVYQTKYGLWTNDMFVNYQGSAGDTRVKYGNGGPMRHRNAKLLSESRIPRSAIPLNLSFRLV